VVISRRLVFGLIFSSALITPSFSADITFNPTNGTYWVTDLSRLKTQIQLQKQYQAAEIAVLARQAFKWQTAAAQVAIGAIGLYLINKYSDVHLKDGSVMGTPILTPDTVGDGTSEYVTMYNGCSIISIGDYVIDAATGHTWTVQYSDSAPSGFQHVNNCTNYPPVNGSFPSLFRYPDTYNPYSADQKPVVIPPVEYDPAISPQLWADMANSVPDTDPAWAPFVDAVQASDTRSDTDGDGWSDADDPWPTMAQYNPDNPNSTANADGSVTTTYEDGSTSTSHPDGTVTSKPYNPASSSSPTTTTGEATSETTTTTTTTTTNSDGTTSTVTETHVTTEVTSISMEWPAFCSWAGIVCSAIDWMRAPPVEPDVPDLPHQEIDVGTLTKDFDSGLGSGSCPSPVSVSFMGQTVTYSYDSACWAASSVFRPILLASAFLITGFILMGRGDLT